MSGKITVVIRKSNNDLVSFKMNTKKLDELFYTPKILDEKYCNKLLKKKDDNEKEVSLEEHCEYNSEKAFFAPYGYGLFYIDFSNKLVLSLNDYSGFNVFGSIEVKNDYEKLALNKFRTEIFIHDMSENIKTKINALDQKIDGPFNIFKTIHIIHNVLKMNGEIFFNNKKVIGKNWLDIMSEIYGEDLRVKDYKSLENYLDEKRMKSYKDAKENNDELIIDIEEYSNLRFEIENWKIITESADENIVKKWFDELKSTGTMFTDDEIMAWNKYVFC